MQTLVTDLQKVFSKNYIVGVLPQNSVLGAYSGQRVIIPNHMLSYILTTHRGQIPPEAFISLREGIEKPGVISKDIKGKEDTFNLMKRISNDKVLDMVVMDKNGQKVTHFVAVRNKSARSKARKIIKSGVSYDILDKTLYNSDKE